MDPVWNRPLYVAPVQGRSTWGVNEVYLGWCESLVGGWCGSFYNKNTPEKT